MSEETTIKISFPRKTLGAVVAGLMGLSGWQGLSLRDAGSRLTSVEKRLERIEARLKIIVPDTALTK